MQRMKTKKLKMDPLKKYVELRDALLKEKAWHEARLAQINDALSYGPSPKTTEPSPVAPAARGRGRRVLVGAPGLGKVKPNASGRRTRNSLSLRKTIMQVTKDSPLTKEQILSAVKKVGYQFGTSNPKPSLNAVLYGKPKFTNTGGKFSAPA